MNYTVWVDNKEYCEGIFNYKEDAQKYAIELAKEEFPITIEYMKDMSTKELLNELEEAKIVGVMCLYEVTK